MAGGGESGFDGEFELGGEVGDGFGVLGSVIVVGCGEVG